MRRSLRCLLGCLTACAQPETAGSGPDSLSMSTDSGEVRQVWVSGADRRFHRETCRHLGVPDRQQISVIEATKYYLPCGVCRPPIT